MLLVNTRHKSWHIHESYQRDVEAVAETDEARRLHRGVDVQDARQVLGLLGYDAHRAPRHTGKPHNNIGRPALVHLKEVPPVYHSPDNFLDIVGLHRVLRNDVAQGLIPAVGRVAGFHNRGVFGVVAGEEGEEPAHRLETIRLGVVGEVGHPALRGVGVGAPQLLVRNLLPRYRLDDIRPRDIHLADAPHHKDEVGEGGGVGGSPGAWPQNDRYLGDNPAGQHIALEDLSVAGQAEHPLLNACPAGVAHPHHRGTHLHGQVHDLANLFGHRLRKGTAQDGEILGIDENGAPVHGAPAGYHRVSRHLLLRQAKLGGSVGHQGVQFFKTPLVQKEGDALSGGQFAFGMLLLNTLLAPAETALGLEAQEVLQFGGKGRGFAHCPLWE
ncbi:hypothetical protein HRbin23_01067 [bacterium HR23]|nr:hypothetical protein HRbin23_01067 [bacterium HR23]